MLITTGKKPDAISRRIAHLLSFIVPGAHLENRGNRTLSSLILKARKKRYPRVCTVYKAQGKPATSAFLSLTDDGFSWLSPKIQIEKAVFHSAISRKFISATQLEIRGTKKSVLQELFAPVSYSEKCPSTIKAGAKKLSFFLGRKKMLELDVKYT